MVCLCVSILRDAQVASDPQTGGVDKSDMEDSYRRIWDEIGAGIRPHVSGDMPLIGKSDLPGLFLATGHHRNGILLAKLTADAVTSAIFASA